MTVHGPSGRKTYDVEATVPGWGEEPWHVVEDSTFAFQRHAVAVREGKAKPEPSGAHSVRTLAMAFAAYEAAAANTIIDLDRWKEAR